MQLSEFSSLSIVPRNVQHVCAVWEQLPKGVIVQVLKQLAPNDLMQARQVCSHWSSIARQQTLEVCLTIHPDSNTITLRGFLIVELRPQDDHIEQWLFLRLAAMPLDTFANFLQKLTSQRQHLKGCDIEVELYFPNNGHHELVEQQASKVAMLAAELQRHCGAEFYIVLISAADAWLAPAPSVLQHLAPYLSLVNHYTIQWQIIQSSTLWFAAIDSNVTAEHILALRTATNLQSLCMATQLNNELPNFHSCLEVIASFTQLNKLQLTLPILHVSFEPLCQLSCLEVLGLQCLDQAACCQGVLHSNRNSLHTVKLSAPTWSAATYGVLSKLSALSTVDISIETMELAQAEELRHMQAVNFRVAIFRCDTIDIATMQVLTAVECICSMTLWRLDDIRCEHIRCSRLKQLFIVDSPDFSGNCLRTHASVETLFMLRCCGVNAKGLYYILKRALPGLKRIELASLNLPYASMNLNTEIIDAPPLQLGADVLQALSHGQCLEKLVLLGVQGLTNTALAILHRAFSGRQLKGQAQPRIEVLASVAPEKNWTQASDWLLYPNFHPGYADDTVVIVFNQGCGPSCHNCNYLANT